MRSKVKKRNGEYGICDLCRHEQAILGRKLCPVCLQAIARLAFASGVRASPILTGWGGGIGELAEKREDSVRIHIGDYAYEIRKGHCAEGANSAYWTFLVYKIVPDEELLTHGEDSPSQEHAVRNARQLIALYTELDRVKSDEQSGSNNARCM